MKTQSNISDPDSFYAALIAANEKLSLEHSVELTMRLVFLLANQIGDTHALMACVEAARQPFTQLHGESS